MTWFPSGRWYRLLNRVLNWIPDQWWGRLETCRHTRYWDYDQWHAHRDAELKGKRMKAIPKGSTSGLHKSYFNGSPAHIGPKPAPAPKPAIPGYQPPKGC